MKFLFINLNMLLVVFIKQFVMILPYFHNAKSVGTKKMKTRT